MDLIPKNPSFLNMQPDIVKKAEKLLIAGQFQKAKDLLVEAMEQDPDDPETYYLLGDVFCKLERFKDAIIVLQKANQILPQNPEIYHLLGWAVFMNGDIPAGRAFMEIALKAEPDNVHLLADLTVLEMNSSNFSKSKYYISKAKQIAPDDEMILEVEMITNMTEKLSKQIKNKPN